MSFENDTLPSYEEAIRESGPPPEPTWTRNLNLSQDSNRQLMKTQAITADECIVHLKLLAAIADLRDEVSTIDSLFGIPDHLISSFEDEALKYKIAMQIREKRWATYVNRAVDRFQIWWDRCIPMEGIVSPNASLTYEDVMRNGKFACAPDLAREIPFNLDNLPPLDVVMVWHAYMLNPHTFLDDCLRLSKMGAWATGMPWESINAALDEKTFEYKTSDMARQYFESMTGRSWENLHDPPVKNLTCPKCHSSVQAEWVNEIPNTGILLQFEQGHGYAEKNFSMTCPNCFFLITHEALRVQKFRRDVNFLLQSKMPMPGTLLSKNGQPANTKVTPGFALPNKIIIAPGIRDEILRVVDPTFNPSASIASIRDFFDDLFKSQRGRLAHLSLHPPQLLEEKLAFRRMMSRYWTNSSLLGIDLVGAVIRQGTFITKMDIIDWIHWPSVEARMDRLIHKYRVFFRIISENRSMCVVPTLDVDLAWHTHQLNPQQYFKFSVFQTDGQFINHDDKIEETRLSEAFEETSKKYQSLTRGQPYSECICWYCEAIRESNNTRQGVFKGFSSSSSDSTDHAMRLHDNLGVSLDPANNAHISAHNVIHSPDWRIAQRATMMQQRLQAHYSTVFWRLQKRNKYKNLSDEDGQAALKESYSYYPIIWGYPIFTPLYKPYSVDPGITPGLYASNPACMSLERGGVGNCIGTAGTPQVSGVGCGSTLR